MTHIVNCIRHITALLPLLLQTDFSAQKTLIDICNLAIKGRVKLTVFISHEDMWVGRHMCFL